jgi:hypothetical protein
MFLVAFGLDSAVFCQDKCMIKVLKVGLLFISEDARHHSGGVSTVRSIIGRIH